VHLTSWVVVHSFGRYRWCKVSGVSRKDGCRATARCAAAILLSRCRSTEARRRFHSESEAYSGRSRVSSASGSGASGAFNIDI
jgi:hypothetical protein